MPIARLDRAAILGPVAELVRLGIGRDAALELRTTDDPDRLADLLDRLYAELEASPAPVSECRALVAVLGLDTLAALSGASPSSLRRYAAGERGVPDEVAARVHTLALIVAELAGGYNDFGIRRWFARPRSQLAGKAPAGVLRHGWNPDGAPAMRVRELAAAINSSPAT